MPVLTWGYGTGSTGGTAQPFGLRIQGVDYIGSVPIDSISVSASASSNATLTFSILDTTGTLPIPAGWADVEFVDYTEEEWLFGGLVMGVESTLGPPPIVVHQVRCVDYGVLLDVTRTVAEVKVTSGYLAPLFQTIVGAAPLGGITAIEWEAGGDGRLGELMNAVEHTVSLDSGGETVAALTSVRSACDGFLDRTEAFVIPFEARPSAMWVTPLKQLAILPAGRTFGAAPLEVRQDPTTASHCAAADVSYDTDYRGLESGVYLSDADTTTGGDNSGWYRGTINGYSVMPATYSRTLIDNDYWRAVEATLYLENHQASSAGQVTVACAKNFQPGQLLTIYYPALGLDGVYPITSVATKFVGELQRISTIQFNGERGTVARFWRTRHARAGVKT